MIRSNNLKRPHLQHKPVKIYYVKSSTMHFLFKTKMTKTTTIELHSIQEIFSCAPRDPRQAVIQRKHSESSKKSAINEKKVLYTLYTQETEKDERIRKNVKRPETKGREAIRASRLKCHRISSAVARRAHKGHLRERAKIP